MSNRIRDVKRKYYKLALKENRSSPLGLWKHIKEHVGLSIKSGTTNLIKISDTCIPANKSSGTDNLFARMLTLADPAIIYPLWCLISCSITMCSFLVVWKTAKAQHLHKGNDPLNMDNYRPISILPLLCKTDHWEVREHVSVWLSEYKQPSVLVPVRFQEAPLNWDSPRQTPRSATTRCRCQ